MRAYHFLLPSFTIPIMTRSSSTFAQNNAPDTSVRLRLAIMPFSRIWMTFSLSERVVRLHTPMVDYSHDARTNICIQCVRYLTTTNSPNYRNILLSNICGYLFIDLKMFTLALIQPMIPFCQIRIDCAERRPQSKSDPLFPNRRLNLVTFVENSPHCSSDLARQTYKDCCDTSYSVLSVYYCTRHHTQTIAELRGGRMRHFGDGSETSSVSGRPYMMARLTASESRFAGGGSEDKLTVHIITMITFQEHVD